MKDKPGKNPAVSMCGQAFVDKSGGFLFPGLLECRIKRMKAKKNMQCLCHPKYLNPLVGVKSIESATDVFLFSQREKLPLQFDRWQCHLPSFLYSLEHPILLA